jgi:hypothetical protein
VILQKISYVKNNDATIPFAFEERQIPEKAPKNAFDILTTPTSFQEILRNNSKL